MRIKYIKEQHRRDFKAVFWCHCGHEETWTGYDDDHFHLNVVPDMVCPSCGQTVRDDEYEYRPLRTKYPEGMQL